MIRVFTTTISDTVNAPICVPIAPFHQRRVQLPLGNSELRLMPEGTTHNRCSYVPWGQNGSGAVPSGRGTLHQDWLKLTVVVRGA